MMNTVPSSTVTTAIGNKAVNRQGKHNRAGKLLYGVHHRGTVGVH